MKLKSILGAAAIVFSASVLAQTPATTPAPGTGASQADREKMKADREQMKADHQKMHADREKMRADRQAARAAKAGAAKAAPSTDK